MESLNCEDLGTQAGQSAASRPARRRATHDSCSLEGGTTSPWACPRGYRSTDRGECGLLRRRTGWQPRRHRARHRRRRVRGVVGRREPDGWVDPGARQRIAERRRQRPRRNNRDRRATRPCVPGSPSRVPPWPSAATRGRCPGSWPSPASFSSAAMPVTASVTRCTRQSSTWRGASTHSDPTPSSRDVR